MSIEVSCPICFEPFPFSRLEAHISNHKKPSATIFEKTRKLLGKSTFIQTELNPNKDLILSGLDDASYNKFMELSVEEREGDLSDWLTKRHFIPSTNCTEPNCRLALGMVNGNNNCARCGKGFCNIHLRYQMKLSIEARHDPVNGIWAFCCKECYESRKGYKFSPGVMRRRTIGFQVIRAEKQKNLEKEVNKIQKRLNVILESQREQNRSIVSKISALGNEDVQQIVPWIDASNCSFCGTLFTLLNRKHHCRLCGLILCQSCSLFNNSIRTCSTCNYLCSFHKPLDDSSEMQRLYNSFVRYKNSILGLLPQYHSLISFIKNKALIDYRDQEYQLALKMRKEVLDMGVSIEQIAKQVKGLDGRLGLGVFMGMAGFVRDTVGRMELMPVKFDDNAGKVPNPRMIALEESRRILTEMFGDAMSRRKLEDAQAIKLQLEELETTFLLNL